MIISSSSLPLILSLENISIGNGVRRIHTDLPLASQKKKSQLPPNEGRQYAK